MKVKSILGTALVLGFGMALAEDRTFPNAGGNLASASEWGGTLPGGADKVTVDKGGNYTLSDDVTFNSFNVMVGGCYFDLGNSRLNVGKKGDGALYCKPNGGGRTVFSGGKIEFLNHGRCYPYVAPDSAGVVVFTDGCVITNADYFYATRSTSNGRVEITDGTMIYVTNRFAVLQGDGANNVVEITDGAKVFVKGYAYSELGGTADEIGENELRISGAGALFSKDSDNDFYLGYQTTGNKLVVLDGGKCSLSGKGGLKIRSSHNEVVISNATFESSNAFCLADGSDSSHNIFRVVGKNITKDHVLLPALGSWMVSGHHNMISFEDGAKWKKGSANSFFTNTQHSVFVVKGTGTQFGDTGHNFYLGSSDGKLMSVCADNSVEVLDGAVFNAKRFMLMGVRNALVVSNATLNIAEKNDDVALRIGYKWGDLVPDDCVLCLKGENPKINVDVGVSTNACWVQNNSTVRFEIPEEGYARNHVPLSLGGKFQFESGCRFEIDCEKFARAGGGTLTLIETGYNMTEDTRNALLAGVRGLPEGSNIKVLNRSVKLHCPRGLVISIR